MKATQPRTAILVTAWAVVLITSLLNIVAQEIFHFKPGEDLLYGVAGGVVLAGLALTFAWKAVRPLRSFFAVFLVMNAAQWLIFTRVDQLPFVRAWLQNPSFNVYMLTEQTLKLLVTLIVIAFLFVIKKKRTEFFLAKGDTAAPVEPVRWLGVKAGERWSKFGILLTLFITLGTLTFLIIGGRPSANMLVKVLPFVPAVLLAAAMNAFSEEMTYKASFLSVLEDAVGRQQALLLMAAFFGILHFYGIPYGVVGVLMAGLLGWLLGKSMLETRGLWWAWFIHFWQDVAIFIFLALGSITAGG